VGCDRYPNAIVRLVLILLPFTLLLAGCGSFADGDQAGLESKIATELTRRIELDAPMVEVRSVECVQQASASDCAVQLGVGNVVVSLNYSIAVDANDCWAATARGVRVEGAGSGIDPLKDLSGASDMSGCFA
jgi:hypothetical protein